MLDDIGQNQDILTGMSIDETVSRSRDIPHSVTIKISLVFAMLNYNST